MNLVNAYKIKYLTILLCAFFAHATLAQVVVQRCDVKTGWQSSQTIALDNSDKKEGSASLKIEAQAGSSLWFYKTFTGTYTGISNTGYLSFWLYVSDASKLEGGQIEISSSGESDIQEYNWSLSNDNVVDGWNLMQMQINTADQTGGAADLDNINFFRIHQTLSGPIDVKLDFIKFMPETDVPAWPVLEVPVVDNTSLNGKVMFGYQGWFNHPDDGAGLGWVHWGNLYDPIKSHVDMYPDMREYGLNEKYDSHYTMPDGSMTPVFSSYNRNTVLRHMKWVRDYNLDGVFVQRFISASKNKNQMNHKDTVTAHVMEGCEKYGRVFAIMYDGIGGKAQEMKDDWMHLVDDMGLTHSDRYLHHRGLPLVSLWGYTVRNEATLAELEEMIAFFTNNPDPKYRASLKLGVAWDWYDQSQWLNSFKKVSVISPWFSGSTDHNRGQAWCDANDVDFLPVVHPGFSWHNLTKNYQPGNGAPYINASPRNGGEFLWSEVKNVLSKNAKSVYIAMFDEIDEGTGWISSNK